MATKEQKESVPKKGLLKSKLQKLFGGRSKTQQPNSRQADKTRLADKLNSVYLGDVLDGTGNVILEGGPLPLDQKLFEMVEKYKSEARAAVPSSPVVRPGEPQAPSTPPAVLEDGIAEVVPSNREFHLPSVGEIQPAPLPNPSPLSTLSSINLHSMPYSAADLDMASKDYHSNPLFLESNASDASLRSDFREMQVRTLANAQQGQHAASNVSCKDRILDTWDDALFGPLQEPPSSEVDVSVTISLTAAPAGRSGRRKSAVTSSADAAAVKGALSSKESSKSAHSRHSQQRSPKARRQTTHKPAGNAIAAAKQEPDRRQQHSIEAQHPRRSADWALASAEDIHARGDTAQSRARVMPRQKQQQATQLHAQNLSDADELEGPRLTHSENLLSSQTTSLDLASGEESGKGNDRRDQHVPLARHPRQQRREARKRQEQSAHVRAQQQGPEPQPTHPESRFAREQQQAASRMEPLQDVTKQQANLGGRGVGPNKVVVPPLKAGKGILNMYNDLDEALEASSWEKQLTGGSDSDSSQNQHRSKRRPGNWNKSGKGPGVRRVHFGDEGGAAGRPEVRDRLPSQTGSRDGSITTEPHKGVARKLLGSRDSIRTSQTWSLDYAEEVLAEAFGLSAPFPNNGADDHKDGPMLSPGRFLQLASLTEEGDLKTEWVSRVGTQMELAAKLQEQRPATQVAPAAVSQLHCASDGVTALSRQPPAAPSPPCKRFTVSVVKQQPPTAAAKPTPKDMPPQNAPAPKLRPSSAAQNIQIPAAKKPPWNTRQGPVEAAVGPQPAASQAAPVVPELQARALPSPSVKALPSPPVKFAPSAAIRDGTKMAAKPASRIVPNGPARHSFHPGTKTGPQPLGGKPLHAASHSSTQLLMREAANKSHKDQPHPVDRGAQQPTGGKEYARQSELYAAAQRAIWQGPQNLRAVATRPRAGPMHHFPAGSAPLLGSEDPLRDPYNPPDLDSHPVSVPASPSSVVSVHGHALSTLTMSPSRYTASIMGTPVEEPWAPEMHNVAEEATEDYASLKGVSEYSGTGGTFRPGLATEPATHLTQAMLDTQAVLDTVACDVDLSWLGPLWPPGGTPQTPHDAAKGQLYRGMYHRDAETIHQTPAPDTLRAKEYMLHSTPSDWMHYQPYRESWHAR